MVAVSVFDLFSIGIGLVARRRFARTDLKRAAYLMWGLWLAVHVVVFGDAVLSVMELEEYRPVGCHIAGDRPNANAQEKA